ncbi:MAG: ACP S-malonyltransferase [Nitrospinota bacterium]
MDGKIAFVFPGQGAQKVGMGQNLAEKFPSAKNLMERATQTLGFDLQTLCFEGDIAELSQTQNTQPALLTVSAMALEAFREKSGGAIKPDFVAGHSLGEFSAVYAAGSLSFEDAVGIVRKRGEYMSRASGGVMAAIIGLDVGKVEEICVSASEGDSFIKPANYNGEGQTVIAGTKEALEKATPMLKEAGAKMVVPLKVSAAFHTPFMKEASENLAKDLDALTFDKPEAVLINNIDAAIVDSGDAVREGLKRQVMGAVKWTDIMTQFIDNNVRTVVEFGTGRTLIGMLKRADKTLTLLNVENETSLIKAIEALS